MLGASFHIKYGYLARLHIWATKEGEEVISAKRVKSLSPPHVPISVAAGPEMFGVGRWVADKSSSPRVV